MRKHREKAAFITVPFTGTEHNRALSFSYVVRMSNTYSTTAYLTSTFNMFVAIATATKYIKSAGWLQRRPGYLPGAHRRSALGALQRSPQRGVKRPARTAKPRWHPRKGRLRAAAPNPAEQKETK